MDNQMLNAAQVQANIQKPAEEGSSTLDRIIFAVISIAICSANLLLPVERGYATIRIGPYPITLTIIISLISFTILISTQRDFLSSLFPKYAILQLIFVWYLIATTIFIVDIKYGIFVILNYSVTFVINFWIVSHFLKRGFGHIFIVIICFIAFLASLVGLMEGVFGIVIPFYKQIYIDQGVAYFFSRSIKPFSTRVFGTLGNPIIYSIALSLVIPFVTDLRSRTIKFMLLTIIMIAGLLTISSTSFITMAVFVVGQLFISARNPIRILRFMFVALLLVFATSIIVSEYVPENFVSVWIDETNSRNVNVIARIKILERGIDLIRYDTSPSEFLWGHGSGTARSASSQLNIRTDTFDNTYFSIFYEHGFVGLFLYSIILIYLLLKFFTYSTKSLHWYSVLAYSMIGFAFFTTYYTTFNFVWTASVAFLIFKHNTEERAQLHTKFEHMKYRYRG